MEGSRTYAVKGHPFGLDSAEDTKELIAFLRTICDQEP
jgi:hypothetical protein